MKYKKKIYMNIPVFLVIGVIFLIWGITLLNEGIMNRTNLRHIKTGDIDVTKLREGEYISADSVKAWGGMTEEFPSYCLHAYDYIDYTSHNYYMVRLNDKKGNENKSDKMKPYISLQITENVFFDLMDNIDDDGYLQLSERYDVFNSSFDFKVVKADEHHLYNIEKAKEKIPEYLNMEEVDFFDGIALIPVNFESERKVLVNAMFILFAALVFIIASKPWKIINVKYILQKEITLSYKENADHHDEMVISEEIRKIRLDIKCLEDCYNKIKNNVKKNAISFGISVFVFIVLKELFFDGNLALMMFNLGIVRVIPVVFLIKFFISGVILLLNMDTKLGKSIMSIFNKEPLMSNVSEQQIKLFQCEKIINEIIHKENDEL